MLEQPQEDAPSNGEAPEIGRAPDIGGAPEIGGVPVMVSLEPPSAAPSGETESADPPVATTTEQWDGSLQRMAINSIRMSSISKLSLPSLELDDEEDDDHVPQTPRLVNKDLKEDELAGEVEATPYRQTPGAETFTPGGDLVSYLGEMNDDDDDDDEKVHYEQNTRGDFHLTHGWGPEFDVQGITATVFNFAMEHRIFLKAALDLFAERDRQAPELGMMDPIVLKSGSLKKASHLMNGVWKVKFVEIRRGMFSYYENTASSGEGELMRKNLPLDATSSTCRAVKLHQKALKFSPGGAIFELSVGGSKRLWMASTREERQAWIQAINNAMVGGSVTRGDSITEHRGLVRGVSPKSPFRNDLRLYLKTQTILRNAKSMDDYLQGLRGLLKQPLQVPVKWIADRQGMSLNSEMLDGAFREETISISVEQLWRDLQRDAILINGELLRGDSRHGPERIVSAVAHCILRVAQDATDGQQLRCDISERQALTYARDVLLSGNRTRSGGDSYYCVNTLSRNLDLVVAVPSATEAEPVSIEVSRDESDISARNQLVDKSGWIKTRNILQRNWKKLFFVLSAGTLSYYEGALPRPHGLRGQLVLRDASISITKKEADGTDSKLVAQYILSIAVKEGPTKYLLFDSDERLIDWIYAIECASLANAYGTEAAKKGQRRGSFQEGETPARRRSTQVQISAKQSTKEQAARLGISEATVENRLGMYSKRTPSEVTISINASTDYRICTTDPQGNEEMDTWATLRAVFLQSFRITGGPNGRLFRGEEVVHIALKECLGVSGGTENNVQLSDAPISPSRRLRNRRIFRYTSSGDIIE